MKILDLLPDRPLELDELHDLQHSGKFDSVTTSADAPYGEDHLFIRVGDVEHTFHYTEDKGWHKCGRRELEGDDE